MRPKKFIGTILHTTEVNLPNFLYKKLNKKYDFLCLGFTGLRHRIFSKE
jgi:hypothetical protein